MTTHLTRSICSLVALLTAPAVTALLAQTPAAGAQGRAGGPPNPPLIMTTTAFQDGGVIPDMPRISAWKRTSLRIRDSANAPDPADMLALHPVLAAKLARQGLPLPQFGEFRIPADGRRLGRFNVRLGDVIVGHAFPVRLLSSIDYQQVSNGRSPTDAM